MTTNRNDHELPRPSITAQETIIVVATADGPQKRPPHPVRRWLRAIACFPVCVLIFGILPAGIYLNLTGLAGVGRPLWYWYAAIVFFGTPITAVAYVTGFFGNLAGRANSIGPRESSENGRKP